MIPQVLNKLECIPKGSSKLVVIYSHLESRHFFEVLIWIHYLALALDPFKLVNEISAPDNFKYSPDNNLLKIISHTPKYYLNDMNMA